MYPSGGNFFNGSRLRFYWRQYVNTQTPQGRLGIFVLLMLFLLILSAIDSMTSKDATNLLARFLGRVIGLTIGFTLHEWGHAYSAFRLGGYKALPDPSRLTFDPRQHLDPLGTLLAIFLGFGWARPVPVYPQAFYPNEARGMMLVSLAGPVMNLMLATIVGTLIRLLVIIGILEKQVLFGGISFAFSEVSSLDFTYQVLETFVFFNLVLFLFNLIPLYPLDGWKIMLGLLPTEQAIIIRQYERESMFLLFFVFFFGFAFLNPLLDLLFKLVTGVSYL